MTIQSPPDQATELTPPDHPAPPPPESRSTRHLCAAAHIDEDFWRECLREVYYQSNRAVAPSYGFELAPVLWHCLRARNMVIVRDAAVVGVLLIAVWLAVPTLLWFAPVVAWVAIVVALGRVVRNAVARVSANFSLTPLAGEFARLLAVIAVGTAVALTFAYLLHQALPAMFWGAVSSDRRLPETASSIPGGLVALALAAVPVIWHRLWQQRQLTLLGPGRPVRQRGTTRRLDDLHEQQQGNTVVYSSGRPFIGSGIIIYEGKLDGRLVRANSDPDQNEPPQEFPSAPFTAQQVIDHVTEQLQALATHPEPEEQIPDLRVRGRVYLAGTEVRRPSTVTSAEAVAEIIRRPVRPARYYLVCQVVSWHGELVTTVYVHFAVQGRSLYLQMVTTALPPCNESYRIVEIVDGTGLLAYLRAFGRSVVEAPRAVLAAPLRLIFELSDLLADTITKTAGARASTRGYDYGIRFSVRERGASDRVYTGRVRDILQRQDIEKYALIIQRRVVKSMLDFLEQREVDTTEFVEQAKNHFTYFVGALHKGTGSIIANDIIGHSGPFGPPGDSRSPQRDDPDS